MDLQSGVSLFAAIAGAAKNVADIAKDASKLEMKTQLNGVYDTLTSLKQVAAELEDENRSLKEKLRFKSDDFEFKNPFWFEKRFPERPLCPKCYANEKLGQMSEVRTGSGSSWRTCLVCGKNLDVERARNDFTPWGSQGPNSWMR
jgi:hypothetical protein